MQIIPDETFRCDRTLQSHRFSEATGMSIPRWEEMLAELAGDPEFYDLSRVLINI